MTLIPYEPTYSERDYVAPTVFKLAGKGITGGWNYYGTLNEAIVKWKYLNRWPGGANVEPEGYVSFPAGTTAQTMGINCDFYVFRLNGTGGAGFYLSTYKELKAGIPPHVIYRFYRTDGAGPYYAIFDKEMFGLSATPINAVSAEKLAALDAYYREVQLLKYRYNNLVGFLNSMAKKQLNAKEQQIFNQGVLLLQQLQAQMLSVRGIEITYTKDGAQIGFIPLLIIAGILILSAVAGWTIIEVSSMREKTKRINDAYNLSQWVVQKKQEIAQQVNAGTLTPAQAADITATLNQAQTNADAIAQNAAKNTPGMLEQVTSLVKWGAIAYIGIQGMNLIKDRKKS